MVKTVKYARSALLGIVGYMVSSYLWWVFEFLGIPLTLFFLALMGLGLVWLDFGTLGMGVALYALDVVYVFGFSCVIAITCLREWKQEGR